MPKFCANLTMLYNEVDFLDRFQAAAKSGFKGVEYLFPTSSRYCTTCPRAIGRRASVASPACPIAWANSRTVLAARSIMQRPWAAPRSIASPA